MRVTVNIDEYLYPELSEMLREAPDGKRSGLLLVHSEDGRRWRQGIYLANNQNKEFENNAATGSKEASAPHPHSKPAIESPKRTVLEELNENKEITMDLSALSL